MSISILQHTQGIRAYQFHRSEYKAGVYIAHISKIPNKQQCVGCKSFNVTATFINERVVKALPMGTKQMRVHVKMHRLACHDCQAYRMEDIQFLATPASRTSKCLERTLLDLRK